MSDDSNVNNFAFQHSISWCRPLSEYILPSQYNAEGSIVLVLLEMTFSTNAVFCPMQVACAGRDLRSIEFIEKSIVFKVYAAGFYF